MSCRGVIGLGLLRGEQAKPPIGKAHIGGAVADLSALGVKGHPELRDGAPIIPVGLQLSSLRESPLDPRCGGKGNPLGRVGAKDM